MKMHTLSGKEVSVRDFTPECVDIHDIANSLALLNRFNGHTRQPFSVAKHSIIASAIAPPEFRLEALLHDAGEAYMGDCILPVKTEFPEVSALEDEIAGVIFKTLVPSTDRVRDGRYVKSPVVASIDKRLASYESAYLRPKHPVWYKSEQAYIAWTHIRESIENELDALFFQRVRAFGARSVYTHNAEVDLFIEIYEELTNES